MLWHSFVRTRLALIALLACALWKSDGSSAGTVLVKDINPGPADAFDPTLERHWLANVNGTLFFPAQGASHGYELWKSDGTAAGTLLVKNMGLGEL